MVSNTAYSTVKLGHIQWHQYGWEVRLDLVETRDQTYRASPLTLLRIGLGIADVLRLYQNREQEQPPTRLLLVDWNDSEDRYYALGLSLPRNRSRRLERYAGPQLTFPPPMLRLLKHLAAARHV